MNMNMYYYDVLVLVLVTYVHFTVYPCMIHDTRTQRRRGELLAPVPCGPFRLLGMQGRWWRALAGHLDFFGFANHHAFHKNGLWLLLYHHTLHRNDLHDLLLWLELDDLLLLLARAVGQALPQLQRVLRYHALEATYREAAVRHRVARESERAPHPASEGAGKVQAAGAAAVHGEEEACARDLVHSGIRVFGLQHGRILAVRAPRAQARVEAEARVAEAGEEAVAPRERHARSSPAAPQIPATRPLCRGYRYE